MGFTGKISGLRNQPSLSTRPGTCGTQQSRQRHRVRFSLRCENSFKERLRSGHESHRVGLYQFAERKAEAQRNIAKLAMIVAQFTKDPAADILDEWMIFHALYDEKLCTLVDLLENTDSPRQAYLITPRSDASMNLISRSTSSPRSGSDFNRSSACDVLSLEASRSL